MIEKSNNILLKRIRKYCSSLRSISVLFSIMLLLCSHNLFAQVINNTGVAISVSPNTVVKSKDYENSTGALNNNGTINLTGNFSNNAFSGSLSNDGTLNLTGNFFNAGTSGGNGFFNLIGNWTNNNIFNPGTSTVSFIGSTPQFISHWSSGENFYKLTINNPGNIVTQNANPGSSLTVNNDLTITAGTLILDMTTSSLVVGGKAAISGSLVYNSSATQVATISDVLSGTGVLDMSGGDRPHELNLAGSTNTIGTFLSGTGSSTVNYNGTTQTVFPASNYRNLIISNPGVKTLQGNSIVNLRLKINGGTFNLGTTTTTLTVKQSTTINGSLSFNGTLAKTVSLNDSLTGTGSIDMSGGNLPHLLYLNGTLNNIGTYASGTLSTVDYILNGNQTVFTSDDYRNLKITGSGVKTLSGDVTSKGVLSMFAGDINTNGNTVKVTNGAVNAINRTAGTIIGKLQRTIGVTGSEYLYPIGSSSYYNPMKIKFRNPVPAPLIAQFIQGDVGGTSSLPLDDDDEQIWDRFTEGYWRLTSLASMSSSNFDVKLTTAGFAGVDLSSRIIKRTDGGNLEIDGKNDTLSVLPEMQRDSLLKGISTVTTDLAIGKGRPRITVQPANIDICEGSNAWFQVTARGRGTLTYRWQVDTGLGFGNIFDGAIGNGAAYSGTDKRKLDILAAPYSMNGYLYRCKITDGQGNYNYTDPVLLTVNKIPAAIANLYSQPECPGVAFTDIILGTSNNVTGTTFTWVRNNPAGITTTLPMSDLAAGGVISGIFSNTTDSPIIVTFTITPKGPLTTYCVGNNITVTVTVNPIPKILPVAETIQCDSTYTDLQLASPSLFTTGLVTFKYTVTTTGPVTGYTSPTDGLPNGHHITDKLINLSDVFHLVTYTVVPHSPAGCVDGPSTDIKVNVNPTPRARPINLNNLKPDSSICFAGSTNVLLTTPTQMKPGTGNIIFDFKVSANGGGVVTGSMTPESNLVPGYNIIRTYQNSSDTLHSVYFSITPKVDNAVCNKGPVSVSEIKVHPIPLRTILNTKPLTCKTGGAGLAELQAVISKGANPYHIVWDGPVGYHNVDSFKIRDLSSGKYVARVTDNLVCSFKDSILVSAVAAIANISSPPIPPGNYNLSCIGSSDGTILVFVTNGITPPYNYWLVKNDIDTIGSGIFTSNYDILVPSTFKYYYNLGAGSYTLITKDVNGCEDRKSIVFRVPPPVVVNFGKSTYGNFNVSCKSYNDGSLWIKSISGGRPGYTFRWYTTNGNIPGPVNTNRIDNITAGRYYLEIKDVLGCITIADTIITEPNGMLLSGYQLSKSADNNFNISCNGGNNGSINMTITGGSGIYNFSWTGPNGFTATTKDISGLTVGTYTVTVQDLYGCILTPNPTFTLTQPTLLTVSASASMALDGINNINCNSGTGNINLTVSGGSIGKYRYSWSTTNGSGIIAGQKNQPNLTAGDYNVVVTDTNSCLASTNVTLKQPQAIITQLIPKQITCAAPGFNNGSVNLTVTGGTGIYTYLWSNGATSEDITNLIQGLYKLRVNDSNGCLKKDSVQINNPPPLTFSFDTSSYNGFNISCYGLADGSIKIIPVTGKNPYAFNWTGPGTFVSNSQNISGLSAGQYNLQITDSNLCTSTGTFKLTQPGKLSMQINTSSSVHGPYNLNCAGDSTARINITPVNGVGAVNYLWADGATSKIRSGLPAGKYSVIITDQNYCNADTSIVLTQPDSIKITSAVKQAFCPDSPDGEIRLTVKGGVIVSDYSYRWSDNSTTQNLTNIIKGLFIVTVTDANDCSAIDSILMKTLHSTCLMIPNAISPNGDNINDVWNIGKIELYPNAEVTIFNRWGETLWRSEKGYPQPWDGRNKGALLPIDSYYYIIDLHNGTRPVSGNITIIR
jgi:gliding motility-associated-like protein